VLSVLVESSNISQIFVSSKQKRTNTNARSTVLLYVEPLQPFRCYCLEKNWYSTRYAEVRRAEPPDDAIFKEAQEIAPIKRQQSISISAQSAWRLSCWTTQVGLGWTFSLGRAELAWRTVHWTSRLKPLADLLERLPPWRVAKRLGVEGWCSSILYPKRKYWPELFFSNLDRYAAYSDKYCWIMRS
jgi:hypothetical protein